MIRVHKRLIFALPILLATPAIAQMSQQPTLMCWETGNGRACTDVCNSKGLKAVESGTYSQTSTPYFVCRTNAHQEGTRPGYQVQTLSTCVIGWGNKEETSQTYDCLCIENKEETNQTYDCPYTRASE